MSGWVWGDQNDGMGRRWAWDGWDASSSQDGPSWVQEPAENPGQVATRELFAYWNSLPIAQPTGEILISKHLSYFIVPTANGVEYWIPEIFTGLGEDGFPRTNPFPGETSKKGYWGANYTSGLQMSPNNKNILGLKDVRYPALRPPHAGVSAPLLGFVSTKREPVEVWHEAYVSDDWTNWLADNGYIIVLAVAGAALAAAGAAAGTTTGSAAAGGVEVGTSAITGGAELTGGLWEAVATGWEGATATSSLQNAAFAAVGGDVTAYTGLVSAVGEVGAAEMMVEAASILSAGTGTTSVNLLEQLKDALPKNISDKAVNSAINKAMSYGTKFLLNDPANAVKPGYPYIPRSPGGTVVAPIGGNADTGSNSTALIALLVTVAIALKS